MVNIPPRPIRRTWCPLSLRSLLARVSKSPINFSRQQIGGLRMQCNYFMWEMKIGGLEEDIRNVYDGQGDGATTPPPIPVIREGLYHDAATHRHVRVVSLGIQFSSVEMAPAAFFPWATPMTPVYPPSGARRKRRTRAQMDADAQSSAADLMMPVSAGAFIKEKHKKPRYVVTQLF